MEAQRLGLSAIGSDLNPVAVMIGKAMIEIPPKFKDKEPVHPGAADRNHYRHAEGLAEDVRFYGNWIRDKAIQKIGGLYPSVKLPKEFGGDDATVIAWIWSRTVPSPDPAFANLDVPITASFALCTKSGKEAWVEPVVDKAEKTIQYKIRRGGTKKDIDRAKAGTKSGRGAHFVCLYSGAAITPDYVKAKAQAGEMGEVLIAIVAEGKRGRVYVAPDAAQSQIASSVEPHWRPDLSLPNHSQYIGVLGYGFKKFGDLYSNRQLVALNTFSDLVQEAMAEVHKSARESGWADDGLSLHQGGLGARAYSEAVAVYLSFVVDKCSDYWSSICSWHSSGEKMRNTFGRQAIPMVWDYAEANPFCSSSGNWTAMNDWVWKSIEKFIADVPGKELQHDAQTVEYPANTVISTDPPYYDNIPYADLSDFFYSWMRRALKDIYPDLVATMAVPKMEELVADRIRHSGTSNAERFFMDGMKAAIERMQEQASDSFPATIYYAFKQSEIAEEGISSTGWATFLQAVIDAGYAVVGTWPMRTELANRMRGIGANALATSVVLVCRKRHIEAETVTRAEFIRALKKELPKAIHELQKASITPVDMPQASIGPGIGIYSRYESVLEGDDSVMTVKTALQIINRELDAYLSEQEGEFDPDTRFAVTWFEQNGYSAGDFGDADSVARARGLSVDSVKHAGVVESAAGKVRLLKRDELDPEWTPRNDTHLTVWECTQYLIHALQQGGEYPAALLIKQMGPEMADSARDLAYRLFDICNKKAEAKEAGAYNSLIAVWSELTVRATTITDAELGQEQLSMI